MLNLLYYDMKAILKKSWVYILIFALIAVCVKFFCSEAFISFFTDINFIYGYVVSVVSAGFLVAFGILVTLIIIVYLAQWFDENVLSNQSQLTNMLPVDSWQIVLSKVILAFIWSIIMVSMAVSIISIVMVGTEYFDSFVKSVAEIGSSLNIEINLLGVCVSIGLYVITGLTSLVSLCYFSLMIGQMFSYLRNFAIFVSFVLILLLGLYLEYKLALLLGVSLPTNIATEQILEFCIKAITKLIIINVVSILLYWFGSSFILKR